MSLNGHTGVSAGVESDLQSIIGQTRIIPLYSSVNGNGHNAVYTIVRFVGVTIVDVNLQGSKSTKHITIQPAFVLEPNTIGGGQDLPGKQPPSQFVVRPVALVR